MQELEKILEEIAQEKKDVVLSVEHTTGYKAGQISMAEKIENIIRKHMNDGWISVEVRMPTREECENNYFWIMLKYNASPVIAKCAWIESEDKKGNDDSFSEFFIDQYPQIYTPSKDIVIAWKMADVPEPHRLERRKDGQAD